MRIVDFDQIQEWRIPAKDFTAVLGTPRFVDGVWFLKRGDDIECVVGTHAAAPGDRLLAIGVDMEVPKGCSLCFRAIERVAANDDSEHANIRIIESTTRMEAPVHVRRTLAPDAKLVLRVFAGFVDEPGDRDVEYRFLGAEVKRYRSQAVHASLGAGPCDEHGNIVDEHGKRVA